MPPPTAVARALLHSYATAWFSLVSLKQHQRHNPLDPGDPQTTRALPPPVDPYLPPPRGSRLPAPPHWYLQDAPTLPPDADEEGDKASPPSPVACTLLLAAGLQHAAASGGPDGPRGPQEAAPQVLQHALQLAYTYEADEIAQRRPRGVRRRAGVGAGGAVAVELLWQDPLVRWPLSALTAACLAPEAAGGGGARWLLLPRSWIEPGPAENLVRSYEAASLGDPLFGLHVALLLSRSCCLEVQRAAWEALADGCCLHLLPPLAACLGAADDYLPAAGPQDQQLLSQVGALLASDRLDRALAAGSLPGALAVALLVAQLAAATGTGQAASGVGQAAAGRRQVAAGSGQAADGRSGSSSGDAAASHGGGGSGNGLSASERQQGFGHLRVMLRGGSDAAVAAVAQVLQGTLSAAGLQALVEEACCGQDQLALRFFQQAQRS